MSQPIILDPLSDSHGLTDAIKLATETNRSISLKEGTFYTNSEHLQEVEINAHGLRLNGMDASRMNVVIKRPDFSIDLEHSDGYYGLFFIPSKATEKEFASISSWKTFTKENGDTYEYAVLVRGTITIENIVFDCNMGRQNLDTLSADKYPEHSCMLGFSGSSTDGTGVYEGKKIFVAFERVQLTNIQTLNGGYSDDIWISRGYFNPNIKEVIISNVQSADRAQKKRATIGFSGLAEKIRIEKSNIYRLECEEGSSRWDELPRKDSWYEPSQWFLEDITTKYLDLAAKGKAMYLNANNINVSRGTSLYQLGGIIRNSIFHRKAGEPRLNRLNSLIFQKVKWILYSKPSGEIMSLHPYPQYNEKCSAIFIENEFEVNGEFINGSLITSDYTREHPENKVILAFYNCKYDKRFGSSEYPDTCVVNAKEKGTWTFIKSDFGTRNIDHAIQSNPEHTDVKIKLL